MYEFVLKDDNYDFTIRLLDDALMNAEFDDEELYFAYVKVLEDYVEANRIAEFRKQMIQYWKDKEKERESY